MLLASGGEKPQKASEHPTKSGRAAITEKYPAQTVNSAEAEKPWCGQFPSN